MREATNQTKEALDKLVDTQGSSRHEKPTPPILAEWRDSCRDWLCNLYAYATVSDKAILHFVRMQGQRFLKLSPLARS